MHLFDTSFASSNILTFLLLRFPYLAARNSEWSPSLAEQHLEFIEHLKPPRIIKTHLPFDLLPPALVDTCKVLGQDWAEVQIKLCMNFQVVYIARNPKDVIVSYYYHHKLIKFHNFTGDMETFAQRFMQDKGDAHLFSLLSYLPSFICGYLYSFHSVVRTIFLTRFGLVES